MVNCVAKYGRNGMQKCADHNNVFVTSCLEAIFGIDYSKTIVGWIDLLAGIYKGCVPK